MRYALRSPVSGSGEVTTQAGCDAPHKLHVGRLEVGAALTARQHKGYIRVLVEVRKAAVARVAHNLPAIHDLRDEGHIHTQLLAH